MHISQQTSGSVLDLEAVNMLLDALEDEVFELFDEFVSSVSEEIGQIQALADNKRWEELQALVHTIKGSGGNLGAKSFAEACQSLENNIKQNKMAGIDSHIELIELEFARTRDAMRGLSETK